MNHVSPHNYYTTEQSLTITIAAGHVLLPQYTGILYVTNTETKLPEVHARLMAQNISLHSLLEEAERAHEQQSHDKDTPTLTDPRDSDVRTELEKLRIETTV